MLVATGFEAALSPLNLFHLHDLFKKGTGQGVRGGGKSG